MKKITTYIAAAAVAGLAATVASCEGEKDLIIIEGNLPIKTSTLYMVGDATPNGWSIDSPTPLEPSPEDALLFTWEGNLTAGELKLCLATGSWDAPFIRPVSNGDEIGETAIVDAPFKMHAGDPDDKWNVSVAGKYRLSFNLRDWTMSSTYLAGPDAPVIEPIAADALYIVGEAAPCGWNIDAPTQLERVSDYLFAYEGPLGTGELKACLGLGDWGQSFIRPDHDGCAIDRDGVECENFIFSVAPDNKWVVGTAGDYRLEFDLKEWTIRATFIKEAEPVTDPLESATLYMIGDATPGGWSMDDATAFVRDASDNYIFTWEGELVEGNMKACLEPDGTFSCPFLRPQRNGVTISEAGVEEPTFVYTTNPDDQWRVTQAGKYRITFNLRDYTIAAQKLDAIPDEPSTGKTPLESATLYMIGDATPGGWSMDDATAFVRDASDKYIFTWEGQLSTGEMKACLQPDGTFSCPFLRPEWNGCKIGADGVESATFVYTTDPDDKWQVTRAGRYRLTFDLRNWTVAATSLD